MNRGFHGPPPLLLRIWLLAALCAATAPAFASGAEKGGPSALDPRPSGMLTRIQQFWDLSAEEKARPCAFRMEVDVTFYDPDWKLLFVQDMDGDGAYVPSSELTFPFRTGQRLLVTGQYVPPNADITFSHATIIQAGVSNATAKPVNGSLESWRLFRNKFVSVEGLVDRAVRDDADHLRLTLSIDGTTVAAWVPIKARATLPNLNDAVVRLEGIYNAKLGPDGKMSSLEILVPDVEYITVLNTLDDDERFKVPVVTIAELPMVPPTRLVRVVGRVKSQDVGHVVRIRDASGQVDLITGQVRPCAIDEAIEAVGYPLIKGTLWQLDRGLFRLSSGGSSGPHAQAHDETLRLTGQVMELEVGAAASGQPVWLHGVVTWTDRNAPFFYMQDSSGGMCITCAPGDLLNIYPGCNVGVHGNTAMGRFAPLVRATQVAKLSDLVLPVAVPITLERALTGGEEANWVAMSGYLRRISRQGMWNVLEVVTSAGDFQAVLAPETDLNSLVGGFVRLQGVCTAETNGERKLTGIRLWVPSPEFVQIEQTPPKNPFDVPARSIASLGRFNSAQSFNRLLRVPGVVLYDSPGHFIQMEDQGENLIVFSEGREPLQPGDRIEAVGLLARQGARIALREAIYRRIGKGIQPEPSAFTAQFFPLESNDGRLVRVEGKLIDASHAADQFRMTLQSEKAVFEAYLSAPPPQVANGSTLALTGVYEVKYDEYGHPSSYQINLRTPADIAVLKRPSWLTRRRILGFTGALGAGTLLFVAWVAALRRKVREQTRQIREQVKRESQLEGELQRASKLESLGLLAGGIAHDFNNLLTVVMGNLSLARLEADLEPEVLSSIHDAEKAAIRARDLTQQLLTFAKGGTPIQTAVLLPDVVREVAGFALRGSNVRCQFDIPDGLWPANVDKGQIGQVVQNIVINAMQAMPEGGVIDISMRNETLGAERQQVLAPGRYLQISFTDHGSGIQPGDLEKVFDPYFTTKKHGSGLGLATVHSIVKKHMGHISGTTFRIWLPAADGSPAPFAAPGDAAHSRPAGQDLGRILFMDDELEIRKLGSMMLGRLGYEVTAVSDGTEAMRDYTAAFNEGRPYAAVILDLTVPGGMGGLQTLEQLRNLNPKVKAIVCSGYSNDAVLSNYRAYGFVGMVSKPYETTDLAMALERVLRGGIA